MDRCKMFKTLIAKNYGDPALDSFEKTTEYQLEKRVTLAKILSLKLTETLYDQSMTVLVPPFTYGHSVCSLRINFRKRFLRE